jgi:hypothetical protein
LLLEGADKVALELALRVCAGRVERGGIFAQQRRVEANLLADVVEEVARVAGVLETKRTHLVLRQRRSVGPLPLADARRNLALSGLRLTGLLWHLWTHRLCCRKFVDALFDAYF